MTLRRISFNQKADLTQAILKHENFSVFDTDGAQSVAVAWLEREIESHGMRCRIYSGYRKALLAGAVIPTGITQATALFAGVGMLIHNLATMNPDYEICKSVVGDGIEVTYRKTS
jgi:hypothetical protein